MRIAEIQQKAKKLGIKSTKAYRKAELIRKIQKTEGNLPCFQLRGAYCMESDCCWRKDCLPWS